MYDRIKASILQLGSFSEAQLSEILNRLQFSQVKKGECIVKEGDICRIFYFIKEGSFRHYTILDSGVEATLNLWIENDWLFDYKSFMAQAPTENRIEANADSEVFAFSVVDFHELVKISDSFFRLGRIMEPAIQNQDYQHNRLSPEEKYEHLLASKPQIIQQFPLKHIASYLGMTPETLSRIRKKISS